MLANHGWRNVLDTAMELPVKKRVRYGYRNTSEGMC